MFWIFCSSACYNQRTKPLCLNPLFQSTWTGLVSPLCVAPLALDVVKCLMEGFIHENETHLVMTWVNVLSEALVLLLYQKQWEETGLKLSSKARGRLYESDPFWMLFVCSYSPLSFTRYTIMDIQLWTPWEHRHPWLNKLTHKHKLLTSSNSSQTVMQMTLIIKNTIFISTRMGQCVTNTDCFVSQK